MKDILKYSLRALLATILVLVPWSILAGHISRILSSHRYAFYAIIDTLLILLLIIPIRIIVKGAIRFYKKKDSDSKRLLKSIIFFAITLILTCGIIFALFILLIMTMFGPDGSTILVISPLVLGTLLAYGISIKKKSKHTIRNAIITPLFIYNFTIIYFLSVSTIESWFGIDYDLFYDDPTIKVTTPYGEFSSIDNFYEGYKNNNCYYSIDSIAEYDQYLVMATDSSYLLIDKQDNATNIIEVSSLDELPMDVQQKDFVRASKYIKKIYWQIHNDNYLFVIKSLIALVLSTLATALEYLLCKKLWSKIKNSKIKNFVS